jgi:hypothetical protein
MMTVDSGLGLLKVVVLPLAIFASLTLGCCDDDCGLVVLDTTPPVAPQGVYPVTGDETVTIFWLPNRESDLSRYRIYWRFEGERDFEYLDSTPDNYYVDRGLDNGETYEYVVTAVDRSGNESGDSELIFDTPRPEGFNLRLYNIELRSLGGNFLLTAYDFSEFRRTDWETDVQADILFSNTGDLYLMEAGDADTDIQDAGYIRLEDVDWAPEDGWSGTGTAELIMGHSYIVWTNTNNFAKFEVTDMPTEGPDAGEYVTIKWAYQQVTGLPELMRAGPTSASLGADAQGRRKRTGVAGH